MNYHSLSRRELQALCKEHKIPANKTNVFMADALTTLLGNVGAQTSGVAEAPVAPTEESVGEVVLDPPADDAEKPAVAAPAVKKTAKGRAGRKTAAAAAAAEAVPEDVCSAVKPATKRAPVRGKVSSLATLTAATTSEGSEQAAVVDEPAAVVEEEAKPAPRAARKPAVKAKNAKAPTKPVAEPESPRTGSSASDLTQEKTVAEAAEVESGGECTAATEPAVVETKKASEPVKGKRTQRLASKKAGWRDAENQEKADVGNVKAIVSQIEKTFTDQSDDVVPKESAPVAEIVVENTVMSADVGDAETKETATLDLDDTHIPAAIAPATATEEEIEAPKATAPKRAGRAKKATKAKAGKTKAGPLHASPPKIEVYCDIELEKEPDVVIPEPTAAAKPSEEPPSPAGFGFPTSFASPVKSPSLALMGDDSGCDTPAEELTPVVQNVKRGARRNKNGDNTENVDKENAAEKLDIGNFPQSLRKLRRQLKEVVIKKKGNTPVASPLKDISLNVQSPRMEQSPSFSFQF